MNKSCLKEPPVTKPPINATLHMPQLRVRHGCDARGRAGPLYNFPNKPLLIGWLHQEKMTIDEIREACHREFGIKPSKSTLSRLWQWSIAQNPSPEKTWGRGAAVGFSDSKSIARLDVCGVNLTIEPIATGGIRIAILPKPKFALRGQGHSRKSTRPLQPSMTESGGITSGTA